MTVAVIDVLSIKKSDRAKISSEYLSSEIGYAADRSKNKIYEPKWIKKELSPYQRIEFAIQNHDPDQELDYYIIFDSREELMACYKYFASKRGNNLPFNRVKLHLYLFANDTNIPCFFSLTNDLFTVDTLIACIIGGGPIGVTIGGIVVLVLAAMGVLGAMWVVPIVVLGMGILGVLAAGAIDILPRWKRYESVIEGELQEHEKDDSFANNDRWILTLDNNKTPKFPENSTTEAGDLFTVVPTPVNQVTTPVRVQENEIKIN